VVTLATLALAFLSVTAAAGHAQLPPPQMIPLTRNEIARLLTGPGHPSRTRWYDSRRRHQHRAHATTGARPSKAHERRRLRHGRHARAMAPANPAAGDYDAYAGQYAANVAWREQGGVDGDPFGLLPPLLELLGDVAGRTALDAGCGEGYLARALAARAAQVTGIDLSPRLIELARARDPRGGIDYRVADLSQPVPGTAGRFDAVASYLVLNDITDYRGFAATLAAALKPRGRLALALNNPYGAIIDRHVTDYFDSGAASPYRGLWEAGIKTWYYHRTLEDYFDAFMVAGLQLTKLADIPALADTHRPDACLPHGARFPRFMLLAFIKP